MEAVSKTVLSEQANSKEVDSTALRLRFVHDLTQAIGCLTHYLTRFFSFSNNAKKEKAEVLLEYLVSQYILIQQTNCDVSDTLTDFHAVIAKLEQQTRCEPFIGPDYIDGLRCVIRFLDKEIFYGDNGQSQHARFYRPNRTRRDFQKKCASTIFDLDITSGVIWESCYNAKINETTEKFHMDGIDIDNERGFTRIKQLDPHKFKRVHSANKNKLLDSWKRLYDAFAISHEEVGHSKLESFMPKYPFPYSFVPAKSPERIEKEERIIKLLYPL